jgi:hypothetical protein
MAAAAISSITVTNASTPWVSVYSTAAAATLTLQNVGGQAMRIRIDANAATSDAANSAALVLNAWEVRTYTVASGDKVMVSMFDPTMTGTLTKLAQ